MGCEKVRSGGLSSICRAPGQSHTWAFSTGRGTPTTVIILEAGLEKMIPMLPGSPVEGLLCLSLRFACSYVLPVTTCIHCDPSDGFLSLVVELSNGVCGSDHRGRLGAPEVG